MSKNERIKELERKVELLEMREIGRLLDRLTTPCYPVYPVCPQPPFWPYITWTSGNTLGEDEEHSGAVVVGDDL